MSQVQLLYRLQKMDTEIQEKKQRLADVLRAQRETAALRQARQEAETAADQLHKLRSQQTDLSLELESLNTKAKRSERRLYSGKVTNPKELSDLQSEIDSLGRRRAALEDEMLEVMIALEEAEEEKTAADARLAKVERSWEKSQASLRNERQELALSLQKLMAERKKHADLLAEPTRADYEGLLQRKNGQAVAVLRGNMCVGCRTTVSSQYVRDVRESQLVHCPNCGRILSQAG